METVFLRMPINEQTTVEEVEEHFARFAEIFKAQIKIKNNTFPEGPECR